jgi:hypothetical protein
MQKGAATRTGDLAGELAGWMFALGVVTAALFPFALPLIALTAVSLIPFLVVPLAMALVALPFLLLRRLARWAAGALRSSTADEFNAGLASQETRAHRQLDLRKAGTGNAPDSHHIRHPRRRLPGAGRA